MPGDILPCSYKDQLLSDDLLGSGSDVVHTLYPHHWVVGFQRFRDSLDSFHLVDHPLHSVLCLFVQISQVCPKLAGQQLY